jgi:hypothetical protein
MLVCTTACVSYCCCCALLPCCSPLQAPAMMWNEGHSWTLTAFLLP